MQAIETRYLPATNTRGSRIKASCERGSVTISYPSDLSGDEIHRHAARVLIAKFVKEDAKQYGTPPEGNPFNRPFLTAGLPGNGCVHVFADPLSNAVLVQCADEKDASYVQRYIELARKTNGTVTGILHGCACSALKRSKGVAL